MKLFASAEDLDEGPWGLQEGGGLASWCAVERVGLRHKLDFAGG